MNEDDKSADEKKYERRLGKKHYEKLLNFLPSYLEKYLSVTLAASPLYIPSYTGGLGGWRDENGGTEVRLTDVYTGSCDIRGQCRIPPVTLLDNLRAATKIIYRINESLA